MRIITREHFKIYKSEGWAFHCRKLFEEWQHEQHATRRAANRELSDVEKRNRRAR